ncbi:MAG: asparagine synthetase B [Methanomassiliicoccales archaeon PtaB.Bin215]|nr:MAG: asparagine synthetase B [Methanomassiliicoccales archaeon PtaB.Bin215]
MLFSHARADIRERAELDLDESGEELLSRLKGSLEVISKGRTAVLFSGGLDSTLLTALAKPFTEIRLYTVGYPASHDLDAGRKGAEELGLPWEPILIDDAILRGAVAYLRDRVGVTDPVTVSFEVPLYMVCANVPEKVLLSGQGADELFGGYARYSSMSPAELEQARAADLQSLLFGGFIREVRMAQDLGKTLVCPYLDLPVVETALSIPSQELFGELGNKQPLRRLAMGMGLNAAKAPKKAAQYGSGVMKAMKRMANSEGKDLRQWVAEVKG